MTTGNPNPYAPPAPTESAPSTATGGDDPLVRVECERSIRFAGAATADDLNRYLRSHEDVGYLWLASVWILTTLLLGFVAVWSWPWGTWIAAGGWGLTSVLLGVSTRAYRRSVFRSSHPYWDGRIEGELNASGIRVQRESTTTQFAWPWFGHAMIGEGLVALLPPTHRGPPILLTRGMFRSDDAWQRVELIAEELDGFRQSSPQGWGEEKIRLALRDPRRARRVSCPPEGIPFEGPVHASDWWNLPRQHRRIERPARAYVVWGVLVASLTLMLVGTLQIYSRLGDAAAIVLIVGAIGVLSLWLWPSRRRRSRGELLYYLKGYADADSLVSDFGLAATTVRWSAIHAVHRGDDIIALRRRPWNHYVLLRRSMFDSDTAWAQFDRWAATAPSSQSSPHDIQGVRSS